MIKLKYNKRQSGMGIENRKTENPKMCICCCFPNVVRFCLHPSSDVAVRFKLNTLSKFNLFSSSFFFLLSFGIQSCFVFVFSFATKHYFIKVTSGRLRISVPMSYLIWRTSNSVCVQLVLGGPPIRV